MAASTPAVVSDKIVVMKPERPNEAAFREAESKAKKEIEDTQSKLDEIRAKIDLAMSNKSENPRQDELKKELAEIRSRVAERKGSRQKTEEQISALQENINARVKELNAKTHRMPYRTLADLESAVAKLERDIESGLMKIVDERRALQEINNLNKQKKSFGEIEAAKKTIDADRVKLKELKELKQDPVFKELNDRYSTLDKELRDIKAEQNSAYESINALHSERRRLQDVKHEQSQSLGRLRDGFTRQRNDYQNYEREARRIQDERRAKELAEIRLQKKLATAAAKLEAASIPAYSEEIIACENLIIFFDPSAAEAARKSKNATAPRDLAAKAVSDVKPFEGKQGKALVKVEEDYFVGTGGKKKGKKNRAAPADEKSETTAAASKKINLNVGVLGELAKVDVPTPASAADVPRVLEKLREKLQYYKDNQGKVTQANIVKAKKEIARLGGGSEEATEGVIEHDALPYAASPAAASPAAASPAAEEEKQEEKGQEDEKDEAPAAPAEAVNEENPKEEAVNES